jgi:hypothetical protein
MYPRRLRRILVAQFSRRAWEEKMIRWNPKVPLVFIVVALAIVGPAVGITDFALGGLDGRGFKW